MRTTKIRNALRADETEIFELLRASGWAHRVASKESLHALLLSSQGKVVAIRNGQIVGFARAITDGLSNGYLSMVAVSEAFRREGIGRLLVLHLLQGNPGVTWVLRADRPGAAEFFRKLGFTMSADAMERKRGEGAA